ncbi:Zinc finger protein 26 [Halotydeus destructor]|nr:Zinc finger protein 26 [Halotydeus destructor]
MGHGRALAATEPAPFDDASPGNLIIDEKTYSFSHSENSMFCEYDKSVATKFQCAEAVRVMEDDRHFHDKVTVEDGHPTTDANITEEYPERVTSIQGDAPRPNADTEYMEIEDSWSGLTDQVCAMGSRLVHDSPQRQQVDVCLNEKVIIAKIGTQKSHSESQCSLPAGAETSYSSRHGVLEASECRSAEPIVTKRCTPGSYKSGGDTNVSQTPARSKLPLSFKDAAIDKNGSAKASEQKKESQIETNCLYEEILFRKRCPRCAVEFHSEACFYIHGPCFLVENNVPKIRSSVSTGEKRFKCTKCPSAFQYLAGLSYHYRMHCAYAYCCKICNHKSYRLHDMKKHIRVHTGKFYSFVKRIVVTDSTSPDYPYKCYLCPQIFKTITTLDGHVNHCHRRTPYKCHVPTCGSSFSSREGYKTHVKFHENNAIRKCQLCGETFPSVRGLKRHRCRMANQKLTANEEIEMIDLTSDTDETLSTVTPESAKPLGSQLSAEMETITITPGLLVRRENGRRNKQLRIIVTGKSFKDHADNMELFCKKNTAISVEYPSIKSIENNGQNTNVLCSSGDSEKKDSRTNVCGLCRKVFEKESSYISHLPCFFSNRSPV